MLTRYSIYVPIGEPISLFLFLALSISGLLRVQLWNLKDAARGEPPQVSRYPHEYVCHGMNVHKGTPRVLATLHIHEFINRATRTLSLVASGQFFDSDT